MSKVGEWKKDGQVIRIKDMDTDHLRNSIRFIYRKIARQDVVIPYGIPPTGDTWRNASSSKFFEDKFVELAEEAQSRKLIPEVCTFEQLLTIVAGWERDIVRNREAWAAARSRSTYRSTAYPKFTEMKPTQPEKVERNISFEL